MIATASSRRPAVLVVDDDGLSRKHLRTVLNFHGFAPCCVDSAAAARAALADGVPDLVLLDLQMPGENGYELLAWLRGQPGLAALPVICVTASVSPDDRQRVLDAGFAALVSKPITPPGRLLEAIRAAGVSAPPLH